MMQILPYTLTQCGIAMISQIKYAISQTKNTSFLLIGIQQYSSGRMFELDFQVEKWERSSIFAYIIRTTSTINARGAESGVTEKMHHEIPIERKVYSRSALASRLKCF